MLLCAAALALAPCLGFAAEPEPLPEYQVKAAFLYNFALFVDWPADAFVSANAPFTICVVGRDPFGSLLDRAVQGRSAHNRPIQVLRLLPQESPSSCHLLYAADSASARAALASVAPGAILTVSDSTPPGCTGTIVGLRLKDRRVRFEIDLEAARRAGFQLSSKILSLAVKVDSADETRRSSR